MFRLFDDLPDIPWPQEKRCAIIIYKQGIYELPHELRDELSLRTLENYQISGECLNVIKR